MTKVTLTECSWTQLTSYDNLYSAYKKARKGKSFKPYVVEFEKDLENNLINLQTELLLHSYNPKPLKSFIIRDPKTRTISKSEFRDRVIHHAVCNIIEPIFDKTFIYDSFANRKKKGTLKAIERFNHFKRIVSKNHSRNCYVLKADIKHYFDEVNHKILVNIIKKKIKDERIIWLIRKIIDNYKTVGMPLGNLTSQFFANVYLNEIDQFVKHNLKVKHYIRYVDDFVILESNKDILEDYKTRINSFLKDKLAIQLHPNKSKIVRYSNGVNFLGFRIFKHHILLRRNNIRTMKRRFYSMIKSESSYDDVYEYFQGWLNYASHGNTYNLRTSVQEDLKTAFIGQISSIEIDRLSRGIV